MGNVTYNTLLFNMILTCGHISIVKPTRNTSFSNLFYLE